MKQFERSGDPLQKHLCRELRCLVMWPRDAANLGDGGETVVHLRDIPVSLPRVAPRPVNAETPFARRVRPGDLHLVVGSGAGFRSHDTFSEWPLARNRRALMPGRKKYAPPRIVVKEGRPLIRFRIGRFGIVMSNVPSCVPTIGSRSLPRSLNVGSFTQTFIANSNWRIKLAQPMNAAMPRSTPSSGAPSGRGGP